MNAVRRVARLVGWTWFALVIVLALALVGLRLMGGQVDLIESNSMAPAIPYDAIAITMPAQGDELAVGDVITFVDGGERLVMHRIDEVLTTGETKRFRTKGDANRSTDPLLLHQVHVERELWFSVNGLGPIARALQPPTGLAWLACFPAALLALSDRRNSSKTVESVVSARVATT